MSTSRPRAVGPESEPLARPDLLERIDRAVADLRAAVREAGARRSGASAAPSPRRPGLIGGGVVLVTDDGRGVARAVAADLRALGYPVVRVRHGVGEGDVEGVNLTAAAAVAALIDRARARGPLAAIVHAAPLHPPDGPRAQRGQLDEARSLALLAQAAAEDLKAAAQAGGSALIVARPAADPEDGEAGRLGRWVEISARSLAGVRVRGLDLDPDGEPEVQAAEIVRATLGVGEPAPIAGRIEQARPDSRAVLLGAPDRAAWILVAAALMDWLKEAPDVRLADLAYTLHRDQPAFPFRVGLVATGPADLADRLRATIAALADPTCTAIGDPSGIYWADATGSPLPTRRGGPDPWTRRLKGIARPSGPTHHRPDLRPEALIERTGREWLQHLIASRFASGAIRPDELPREPEARTLDFSASPRALPIGEADGEDEPEPPRPLSQALDALDEAIALRRELLAEMLGL